jgi:recombinational DNA repair protein (RecF pathway)
MDDPGDESDEDAPEECADCRRTLPDPRYYTRDGENPLCLPCWEARYGEDGWDVETYGDDWDDDGDDF